MPDAVGHRMLAWPAAAAKECDDAKDRAEQHEDRQRKHEQRDTIAGVEHMALRSNARSEWPQ